jgi:hypothetical protein
MLNGAFHVIGKPIDFPTLFAALKAALPSDDFVADQPSNNFEEMKQVSLKALAYFGVPRDAVMFGASSSNRFSEAIPQIAEKYLISFGYVHVFDKNEHHRRHVAMHEACHVAHGRKWPNAQSHGEKFKLQEIEVNRALFGYSLLYGLDQVSMQEGPYANKLIKDGEVVWTEAPDVEQYIRDAVERARQARLAEAESKLADLFSARRASTTSGRLHKQASAHLDQISTSPAPLVRLILRSPLAAPMDLSKAPKAAPSRSRTNP